jgi:hypothetical protein
MPRGIRNSVTYKDEIANKTSGSPVTTFPIKKLVPFTGKENLVPNEPAYFVNGKKLIAVTKKPFKKDKEGNQCFNISRKLVVNIDDKTSKGQFIRKVLKDKGIPGA